MEIPGPVEACLEGERPERAVDLGDEDTLFFTPSQTVLYHGEGLLSDESVEVYSHDIERLDLSEGRRKATLTLTSVGGTDQFSVPRDHSNQVLQGLLAGILRTKGVLADGERVVSVYRFSELTLVVTDTQLVKHVGAPVWDAEYESFSFAEVTGLEFEDASVATQVVLWVNGRPERIKAPNDEGPLLRRTLVEALCAFNDVDSLPQLNNVLAPAHDAASDPPRDAASDIELDDSIAPLVGDTDEDGPTGGDEADPDHSGESTTREGETTTERQHGDTGGTEPDRSAELGALQQQVSELTAAVEQQNRRLERHEETIAALVDRLEQREE